MADSREGDTREDDTDTLALFDILNHDLIYNGANEADELTEVDKLLSQVLLPSDFDFSLPALSSELESTRFGP